MYQKTYVVKYILERHAGNEGRDRLPR